MDLFLVTLYTYSKSSYCDFGDSGPEMASRSLLECKRYVVAAVLDDNKSLGRDSPDEDSDENTDSDDAPSDSDSTSPDLETKEARLKTKEVRPETDEERLEKEEARLDKQLKKFKVAVSNINGGDGFDEIGTYSADYHPEEGYGGRAFTIWQMTGF